MRVSEAIFINIKNPDTIMPCLHQDPLYGHPATEIYGF